MGFDLGDYKQVSDRIDRHRDAERTYPDGSFRLADQLPPDRRVRLCDVQSNRSTAPPTTCAPG